jgi:hypothetical protein
MLGSSCNSSWSAANSRRIMEGRRERDCGAESDWTISRTRSKRFYRCESDYELALCLATNIDTTLNSCRNAVLGIGLPSWVQTLQTCVAVSLVGLILTPRTSTVKLPMLLQLVPPLAPRHVFLITSQVTDTQRITNLHISFCPKLPRPTVTSFPYIWSTAVIPIARCCPEAVA